MIILALNKIKYSFEFCIFINDCLLGFSILVHLLQTKRWKQLAAINWRMAVKANSSMVLQ